MIYTFRYKGQTKPCICFDEIQVLKVLDRLRAVGEDYTLLRFEASRQKVEQVKPLKPLVITEFRFKGKFMEVGV